MILYISVNGLKKLTSQETGFLRDLIHILGRKVRTTASGEIPKNIFDVDDRYGYYSIDLCIY